MPILTSEAKCTKGAGVLSASCFFIFSVTFILPCFFTFFAIPKSLKSTVLLTKSYQISLENTRLNTKTRKYPKHYRR